MMRDLFFDELPIAIHKCNSGKIIYQGHRDVGCWVIMLNGKVPADIDYYTAIRKCADKYSSREKMFEDCTVIYKMAQLTDKEEDWNIIVKLASAYKSKGGSKVANVMEEVFGILYCKMIAENNRLDKFCGKQLQNLILYEILINNKSINEVLQELYNNVDKIKDYYEFYNGKLLSW